MAHRSLRSRRRSRKSPRVRNRLLRAERLEPRTLLSGSALWSWTAGAALPRVSAKAAALNAPPTVGQPIRIVGSSTISGKSASLSVLGRDDGGASKLVYAWSVTSAPEGGTATFSANGTNAAKRTTITFTAAGTYAVSVRIIDRGGLSVSTVKTLVVNQTLSKVTVSPGVLSIPQGATQQFAAQGLDQFGRAMVNPQTFTWSATGGSITAAGLFTAPGTAGSYTVTARCGRLAGVAAVTVTATPAPTPPPNGSLASLVQSLVADGSISRLDMIQILRAAGTDGVVDATEFAYLKTMLSQAATLHMPGYVQVLAGDVINGNAANAKFQGQALGNLAAGSSAAQLNKLIDKWFFGADRPTPCNTSLTYRAVAGSLFAQTPSHLDERQGQLGDCYFIAALGTLADSNPAAVRNMFIDNGDGTYTVRFYTGTYGTIYNYSDGSISAGFREGVGTVDYVTVDRFLPTTSTGMLVYANYGASYTNSANTLWIALAEKAYAQWNETGKEGRDGLNAYASIQGGWMATVDAQVLGYNATDYFPTAANKQVVINALAAHKAVTLGTLSWSGTQYGLYATHAYAIIGYDGSTDTFTLYNPWGSNQPGPLTWSQLQASVSQIVVADASGTAAISGGVLKSASAALTALHHQSLHGGHVRAAATTSGVLSARLVDALFARQ